MKQVALVTGGSRGIGMGIAKALSQSGFDLAINGVRPAEFTDTVGYLIDLRIGVGSSVLRISHKAFRRTVVDHQIRYIDIFHHGTPPIAFWPRVRKTQNRSHHRKVARFKPPPA